MTRVEKFHRYREEIANMRFESLSSKKTASKKMDDFGSTNVEYDEIMGIHDIYESNKKTKKKYHLTINKYKVKYWSIAIVCNAIILLAIILTGIQIWG